MLSSLCWDFGSEFFTGLKKTFPGPLTRRDGGQKGVEAVMERQKKTKGNEGMKRNLPKDGCEMYSN